MKAKQLELALWEQLRLAQQVPETGDVGAMLDAVEATAAQLPDAEQLRLAGEALLQVATLCAARAEVLLTEWEAAYRDPIVAQGFFADVVRQTMAVDLSELMEPVPPRKRRTKSTDKAEGLIASPVDKRVALALLDQLEAEATAATVQEQEVWSIAHDENVTQWSRAINQCLQAAPDQAVPFAELCRSLEMPWVEVWLGLLLGNFALEQNGEFYGSTIWAKCSISQATAVKI